ncbi:hypothetical protein MASR1M48_16320 [Lactococcus petauri]
MKKFLIFKKTESGYAEKMGSYESEFKDDTSENRSYLLAEPLASHFELAEGQDEEIVIPAFIEEVLPVQAIADKWTKVGEADVFIDPLDPSWTFVAGSPEVVGVPAHWGLVNSPELVAAKALKTKSALVQAAYNQMNADVYAQMSLVFGTNNSESASAYSETFKLMKESPADFIGVLGLQTEAEILAMANAKLAEIKAYALWRMGRIEQFKAERAVILAN